MKTVLVTGASGFIGSNILKYVIEKGYQGIGWDRNDTDGVEYVDLENLDRVSDALKSLKPDVVIHCAGLADVGKSFIDPQSDFNSNVLCTHNLLYAIKEAQINPKVLFLSSAAVYGNPSSLPVKEDAPRSPMSPYALHKMMSEDICLFFSKHYGLSIKVARIFSAYGRGLKKQIFWDMNNKLSNTGKISLFGAGNETRDYIHINDLVKALFLIAVSESTENVFNVANGEEVSIKCAAENFAEFNGLNQAAIEFNGVIREGDPLYWKADISKLKSLGYKREISFSDGVKDYVEWLKKNCR